MRKVGKDTFSNCKSLTQKRKVISVTVMPQKFRFEEQKAANARTDQFGGEGRRNTLRGRLLLSPLSNDLVMGISDFLMA